jgi:hypothetical protein
MRHRLSRRFAVLATVAAVFAIAAVGAVAGTAAMNQIDNNNTATLPSKNPTDLKAAQGKAWAWGIPGSALQPDAANVVGWGNPEVSGGGSVTIGKLTQDDADNGYVTVTVRSLDTGLVITNAMATISGGQWQAVQIVSTSLAKNGMAYTVKLKFPGMQGTTGQLNLKWYTEQLSL